MLQSIQSVSDNNYHQYFLKVHFTNSITQQYRRAIIAYFWFNIHSSKKKTEVFLKDWIF